MIRNIFYYKVKTLIPDITELPINNLINELMNSSNYLEKKKEPFQAKKKNTLIGLFLKTGNPYETEFSDNKTARVRKRLP